MDSRVAGFLRYAIAALHKQDYRFLQHYERSGSRLNVYAHSRYGTERPVP